MTETGELRQRREEKIRRHMEAENIHEFDDVIDTFSHPRYELIATDRTPDLIAPFSYDRFLTGQLVGEKGAAAVGH